MSIEDRIKSLEEKREQLYKKMESFQREQLKTRDEILACEGALVELKSLLGEEKNDTKGDIK